MGGLIALAWLANGCTTATPSPAVQVKPSPAVQVKPPAATDHGICKSDGKFNFSISGSKLEAFEGRNVWAAAIQHPSEGVPKRVVRLETRIVNGRFRLSCPRSLDTAFNYPSWTVVIDADNDGKCSSADRQRTTQLYGWDFDVVVDVTSDAAGNVWDWRTTVAEAHSAVGNSGSLDFCRYYFDAPK